MSVFFQRGTHPRSAINLVVMQAVGDFLDGRSKLTEAVSEAVTEADGKQDHGFDSEDEHDSNLRETPQVEEDSEEEQVNQLIEPKQETEEDNSTTAGVEEVPKPRRLQPATADSEVEDTLVVSSLTAADHTEETQNGSTSEVPVEQSDKEKKAEGEGVEVEIDQEKKQQPETETDDFVNSLTAADHTEETQNGSTSEVPVEQSEKEKKVEGEGVEVEIDQEKQQQLETDDLANGKNIETNPVDTNQQNQQPADQSLPMKHVEDSHMNMALKPSSQPDESSKETTPPENTIAPEKRQVKLASFFNASILQANRVEADQTSASHTTDAVEPSVPEIESPETLHRLRELKATSLDDSKQDTNGKNKEDTENKGDGKDHGKEKKDKEKKPKEKKEKKGDVNEKSRKDKKKDSKKEKKEKKDKKNDAIDTDKPAKRRRQDTNDEDSLESDQHKRGGGSRGKKRDFDGDEKALKKVNAKAKAKGSAKASAKSSMAKASPKCKGKGRGRGRGRGKQFAEDDVH